ncbi:lysis protein [Sodalis sp.]|uniref:lysis protein n=1 Tax=Sodalis sp. (in: enterobacteria) TaxID=1898979 RepID=UPI003872CBD5
MRWTFPLTIVALLALMAGAALYYRARYLDVEQSRQRIEAQAASRRAEIEQLNHQIQTVTALDKQHTRELENDKKRIAQLERDVAGGRRRLQVSATCPGVSARATARLDDAAGARPTDAAQRNYFTLRRRIDIAEEQINGLQDYVRQVCLTANARTK